MQTQKITYFQNKLFVLLPWCCLRYTLEVRPICFHYLCKLSSLDKDSQLWGRLGRLELSSFSDCDTNERHVFIKCGIMHTELPSAANFWWVILAICILSELGNRSVIKFHGGGIANGEYCYKTLLTRHKPPPSQPPGYALCCGVLNFLILKPCHLYILFIWRLRLYKNKLSVY